MFVIYKKGKALKSGGRGELIALNDPPPPYGHIKTYFPFNVLGRYLKLPIYFIL